MARPIFIWRPVGPLQRAKAEVPRVWFYAWGGALVRREMDTAHRHQVVRGQGALEPDGRTIYFISNRNSAFFDVWGLRFDPEAGRSVGEEFRVTRHIGGAELLGRMGQMGCILL